MLTIIATTYPTSTICFSLSRTLQLLSSVNLPLHNNLQSLCHHLCFVGWHGKARRSNTPKVLLYSKRAAELDGSLSLSDARAQALPACNPGSLPSLWLCPWPASQTNARGCKYYHRAPFRGHSWVQATLFCSRASEYRRGGGDLPFERILKQSGSSGLRGRRF